MQCFRLKVKLCLIRPKEKGKFPLICISFVCNRQSRRQQSLVLIMRVNIGEVKYASLRVIAA